MRAMTQRARAGRAAETRSEAMLWSELRNRRLLGTKWRRQQKMGRFVVDFFCAEHALVLEIDGSSHEGRYVADTERQRALELTGVSFVRFTAEEVEGDLPAVVARLSRLLSSPSPPVGEGERARTAGRSRG
jgi:adenine-specific DNA-methyltransferase